MFVEGDGAGFPPRGTFYREDKVILFGAAMNIGTAGWWETGGQEEST